MNERSSRSHTIFKITLESKERVSDDGDEEDDGAVLVAHLNLVDLAGSENVCSRVLLSQLTPQLKYITLTQTPTGKTHGRRR